MLNFDSTRRPVGPAALESLVRAILNAESVDERDWLEWKLKVDPSQDEGRFTLARAVLGLANRDPAVAIGDCDGYGYVVVGASHDNHLEPFPPLDATILGGRLRVYLGAAGPRPAFHQVTIDNSSVLVIEVQPPRPRDPIYPLRKNCSGFRGGAAEGCIFVRRDTATEPASSADIDMLAHRLLAADRLELRLALSGDPVLVVDDDRDEAWRAYIDAERARLERPKPKPPPTTMTGVPGIDVRKLVGPSLEIMRDGRSTAAYDASVEKYLKDLKQAWPQAISQGLALTRSGGVTVDVTNTTTRVVQDVEVRMKLPSQLIVVHKPWQSILPTPPRVWGSPSILDAYQLPITGVDYVARASGPTIERLPDGTWLVDFRIGEVRQNRTVTSDPIYALCLAGAPAPSAVEVTATASGLDGEVIAQLALPVHTGAVPTDELVMQVVRDEGVVPA
jgi:hypothetical protein